MSSRGAKAVPAKDMNKDKDKHSQHPPKTCAPHSLAPRKTPSQLPAPGPAPAKHRPSIKDVGSAAQTKAEPKPDARAVAEATPAEQPAIAAAAPQTAAPDGADRPTEPPAPLDRSLKRIPIKALVDTIQPILEHPTRPYTPLIIDPSSRIDIFFTYSGDYAGLFLEAKKYVVETLILKRMSHDDAMEDMRTILVAALKHGRTLVIRMSDSAADFLKRFTDETRFPAHTVMQRGGRRMYDEAHWRPVVRDADLENGMFVPRPGFWVVVTSAFEVEDYEEFLGKSVPLDEMVPVYIEPPPPASASNSQDGGVASAAGKPMPGYEGYSM
ncbi:hypothetical protein BC831DRAFT_447111 [Entophlyctis helioformis]|nr:hypothetical protein BC831DRAFT_447111 [Entophlyctis helioformis]